MLWVRGAGIYSWSEVLGNGNPTFSELLRNHTGVDKKSADFCFPFSNLLADLCVCRLLLTAITFDRHVSLPVANLSRVDPAFVSIGHHGKKHFHRVANDQPLLFTSVILVDQCHLAEGRSTNSGKLHKVIKGQLIEGEFERFVGIIGMVIRERKFRAQLYKDILDFSTFMDFGDSGVSAVCFLHCLFLTCLTCLLGSSSSTPVKRGKGSTSGQPSPFTFRPSATSAGGGSGASAFKVCLSSKDIGPSFCHFIFDVSDYKL
jgi:hypothetical protein